MIKTDFIAKKGFEDLFAVVVAKKEQFEIDLEKAKADAIAKVEEEFFTRKDIIDETFSRVSDLVQVEIPDEETIAETELEAITVVAE